MEERPRSGAGGILYGEAMPAVTGQKDMLRLKIQMNKPMNVHN